MTDNQLSDSTYTSNCIGADAEKYRDQLQTLFQSMWPTIEHQLSQMDSACRFDPMYDFIKCLLHHSGTPYQWQQLGIWCITPA